MHAYGGSQRLQRSLLFACCSFTCPSPTPHLLNCNSNLHNCNSNVQFRKNTPVLGQRYRTYAIDLLGYGYSDKPDPR